MFQKVGGQKIKGGGQKRKGGGRGQKKKEVGGQKANYSGKCSFIDWMLLSHTPAPTVQPLKPSNTFFNCDKYICNCNSDKYIYNFGQKHSAIWTQVDWMGYVCSSYTLLHKPPNQQNHQIYNTNHQIGEK